MCLLSEVMSAYDPAYTCSLCNAMQGAVASPYPLAVYDLSAQGKVYRSSVPMHAKRLNGQQVSTANLLVSKGVSSVGKQVAGHDGGPVPDTTLLSRRQVH